MARCIIEAWTDQPISGYSPHTLVDEAAIMLRSWSDSLGIPCYATCAWEGALEERPSDGRPFILERLQYPKTLTAFGRVLRSQVAGLSWCLGSQ